MSNPTSNFGWVMPDPENLVTNLPADFEVFGQAVDSDLADLLGGTTGQVLSKTSGTDLDFTWVTAEVGDITGVTAGTGLTGGGTSGTVTLDIDSTVATLTGTQTLTNKTLTSPDLTTPTISTLTTNGDLLVGTGSGVISRLGVGSTGQILTVDSGLPSWTTPASGGGKVLQVVSGTYSTQVGVSSTSYNDTGLSLSITPTLDTSKIMVMVTQNIGTSATVNVGFSINLVRGATQLWEAPNKADTTTDLQHPISILYLDSPATTSATTYKTQMKCTITGSSSSVFAQLGGLTSMITLMEIGA